MERGDIYLISLDPVLGHEQHGERPVLIVSPGAFNNVTGTPVVLPITRRELCAYKCGRAEVGQWHAGE